jgi:hypothetical protein
MLVIVDSRIQKLVLICRVFSECHECDVKDEEDVFKSNLFLAESESQKSVFDCFFLTVPKDYNQLKMALLSLYPDTCEYPVRSTWVYIFVHGLSQFYASTPTTSAAQRQDPWHRTLLLGRLTKEHKQSLCHRPILHLHKRM